MKIYVPLYFEHENDVTIIFKPHRETHLQLVAQYQKFDDDCGVHHFYVHNVIEDRLSWSNC